MSDQEIDFSIGLALGLQFIERYRRSGVLHAEVHHLPGIRGRCRVSLAVVEGKVASCMIDLGNGRYQPIHLQTLLQIDAEHGPFDWVLQVAPVGNQPAGSLFSSPSPQQPISLPKRSVPRPIASLDSSALNAWEGRDRFILRMVYAFIDGRRSIEEIKASLSLPGHVVEEAIRILQALKVIELS